MGGDTLAKTIGRRYFIRHVVGDTWKEILQQNLLIEDTSAEMLGRRNFSKDTWEKILQRKHWG